MALTPPTLQATQSMQFCLSLCPVSLSPCRELYTRPRICARMPARAHTDTQTHRHTHKQVSNTHTHTSKHIYIYITRASISAIIGVNAGSAGAAASRSFSLSTPSLAESFGAGHKSSIKSTPIMPACAACATKLPGLMWMVCVCVCVCVFSRMCPKA